MRLKIVGYLSCVVLFILNATCCFLSMRSQQYEIAVLNLLGAFWIALHAHVLFFCIERAPDESDGPDT